MACFLAPAAEAIVVSIIKKNQKKKEAAALKSGVSVSTVAASKSGIPWSRKLGWLNNMLWGGVFLLAIEHIWHGEVVPWPPFLTATSNPADIQPMLMEILTVGGSMVLCVTAAWIVMVLAANRIFKKSSVLTTVTE